MCLNPVTLHRPDGSSFQVPCGHCLQCLKLYQDSWSARLAEEIKSWRPVRQGFANVPPVVFFTLDYRPESVPSSYLVTTLHGVVVTDDISSVPRSVPVLRFWTELKESHSAWLARRRDMLTTYHQDLELAYVSQDRRAVPEDFRRGTYRWVPSDHHYWFDYDDLPDFEIDFKTFDRSVVEHPVFDQSHVIRCFGSLSDFDPDEILHVFEFHTVSKPDVQGWLKRCRSALVYDLPEIFDCRVNPRFFDFGVPGSDSVCPLPSSAVPNTFKYFITSEYGPRTHRPHYHGVLFGVTYDEFERYFVRDWELRFGHVDFSVLNSAFGGSTYVAKYCSKGSYEHPYCCRDFFYPNGKEYHSKSYECSLADFGVDCALVHPTFHLISKGIGARYAFTREIQAYYGVELERMLFLHDRVNYRVTDRPGCLGDVITPSADLRSLLCLSDSDCLSGFKSLDVSVDPDSLCLIVSKRDGAGRIIGRSRVAFDTVFDYAAEDHLLNSKYLRTYVTSSKKVKLPSRWHLRPDLCRSRDLSEIRVKIQSLPLPRYFRRWLISPLASLLRSSAASRLHPSIDVPVPGDFFGFGSLDSDLAPCFSPLDPEEVERSVASLRLRDVARRFYRPHNNNLD